MGGLHTTKSCYQCKTTGKIFADLRSSKGYNFPRIEISFLGSTNNEGPVPLVSDL